MKRIISLILIALMLLLTFCSCDSGEGIPFVTTKSQTTLPDNTVTVTFPEGLSIIQIADKLEKNGVCSAAEFISACNTPQEGIEIGNADDRIFLLEGYIFPDTYEFYLDSDVESVIGKFIENFKVKIDDEIKAQADAMGFTVDELLSLASIIQKECDEDIAECANVSSVFHNRLKRSDFPKLQSDPTTFYITDVLGEYLGYVKGTSLDSQSEKIQKYMNLYSTYYCNGLPAGPICNPGMKAIRAALNPADTEYVFFLTDESGKDFYYASTIEQHNENGRKAGLMK